MNYKLKAGSEKVVVGFNKSAKPLGERKDLDVLVEMALRSGQKSLINHFENLPSLEEFLNKKAKNIEVVESENDKTASKDKK